MAIREMLLQAHPCGHLGIDHLTEMPICDKVPLWLKVATIAFHVLTFGIPFAIYHVVKLVRPSLIYTPNRIEEISAGLIEAVAIQNRKPYGAIGLHALRFARRKLLENPHLVPARVGQIGPVNQEIALLKTLYADIYLPRFLETLKGHLVDPWSHPEVLMAADGALKISYAISCLTLDDLPEMVGRIPGNVTFAQVITHRQAYGSHTFFSCQSMYDKIRSGLFFNPATQGFEYLEENVIHSQPFFIRGDIKEEWRNLYNDYSARIRVYIREERLRAQDPRFVDWTAADQQDTPYPQNRR